MTDPRIPIIHALRPPVDEPLWGEDARIIGALLPRPGQGMRKRMRKDVAMGLSLVTAGVGTALVAVGTVGQDDRALALAAGMVSGACTALGVTSVLVGWASRRSAARN